MKSQYIKTMLFRLVQSNKLIDATTGWKSRKADGPNAKSKPHFKTQNRDLRSDVITPFTVGDVEAVRLVYEILEGLDESTLARKLSLGLGNGSSSQNFNKDELPRHLSGSILHHWGAKQIWGVEEAAMLSLGFPVKTSANRALYKFFGSSPYAGYRSYSPSLFPLLEAYEERVDILKSATESGTLKDHKAASYISIFEMLNLSEPDNLKEAVLSFEENCKTGTQDIPAVTPGLYSQQNAKSQASLMILIHSMARSRFKYEVGKSLGPAKQAIEQAVLDAGLTMSQRTIGKYLEEAQSATDLLREKNL